MRFFVLPGLVLMGLTVWSDAFQPTMWQQVGSLPSNPFTTDDNVVTFANGKFYAKTSEYFYESSDGEIWVDLSRTWMTMDFSEVWVMNDVVPFNGGTVFSYDNVGASTVGLALCTLPTLDGNQGNVDDIIGDLDVVWIDDLGLQELGTGYRVYRTSSSNDAQWLVDDSGRVLALLAAQGGNTPSLNLYENGTWEAVNFGGSLVGGTLARGHGRILLATSAGVWESADHGKTWTPEAVLTTKFAGMTPVLVPGDRGQIYEAKSGVFSDDCGETWVPAIAPPSTAAQHETRYANGAWVTVGPGGTIASSSDGVNWTPHDLPGFTADQIDVAYGNGRWVVIGDGTVVVADVDSYNSVSPVAPEVTISRDRVLSFPTECGITYTVQASDDLVDWQFLESVPGDGNAASVPLLGEDPMKYIRVVIP